MKLYLTVLFIFFNSVINCAYSQQKESAFLHSGDTVSVDMMDEDFEFVLNKLETVHPLTINGFSDEQKIIIKNIHRKIKKPLKKSQFYFLVNRLFYTFHDAHTNLWFSMDKGLLLPILWLKNGMYILNFSDDSEYFRFLIHNRFSGLTNNDIQNGDRIISIGGKNLVQIYKELKEMICAENENFLRLMGQDLLVSETYLDFNNLIKSDSVNIIIERDKQVIEKNVPVVKLGQRRKDKNWIEYSIDPENNAAVLNLKQCIFDSRYKSVLREFFKKVKEKDIKNVVLDLRVNDGGDSQVIAEFLGYIDINEYKWYGANIRYSNDLRATSDSSQTGYKHFPPRVVKNEKVGENFLFRGNLFVITSKNTFSSANMFAVTLKDNNIGTIIGEPTGNQPTCFGNPLHFKMPNTQIYFRVSSKKFLRPNFNADSKDSLCPDIEVSTVISDIVYGRDAQMEKIYELIKRK